MDQYESDSGVRYGDKLCKNSVVLKDHIFALQSVFKKFTDKHEQIQSAKDLTKITNSKSKSDTDKDMVIE